jgi:hypothetical protein
MNNSQIAAVRGSFFNYLKNNPSIATSLFSSYDSSAVWAIGSGNPSAVPTVESYYFDSTTGNVWYYNGTDSPAVYSYLCCLFDTRSTRKILINIDYTAINGGSSPQYTFNIPIPALNLGEFISSMITLINVVGTDSADNNDASVSLIDSVYQNPIFSNSPLEGCAENDLILSLPTYQYSGKFSGLYSYILQFTATDLTLLTAGNWSFILEISTIP